MEKLLIKVRMMRTPPADSDSNKRFAVFQPAMVAEPLSTPPMLSSPSLPSRSSSLNGFAVSRLRAVPPDAKVTAAPTRPAWCLEHVKTWALQGAPSENRLEALRLIEVWVPGNILRLNKLQLKNLPPLPYIEKLDASDNEIAVVRPEEWPDSLISVDLNHNWLTQPPSRWPAGVKVIELDDNHLIHAESDWPAALKELSVSGNPLLAVLPGNLPDGVEEVYAERNPAMSRWPDRLPANLGKLNVDDTALPAPDAALPVNLKRLLARRSHFSHFSDALLHLSEQCHVYLGGHRLCEAEVQKIGEHIAVDGYKGPRVYFNDVDHLGGTLATFAGP
jgi:Leucine-rich repeat (LRR) protein